jgi:hypothetical protein
MPSNRTFGSAFQLRPCSVAVLAAKNNDPKLPA